MTTEEIRVVVTVIWPSFIKIFIVTLQPCLDSAVDPVCGLVASPYTYTQ